jgi:hypothetical protein
MAAAMAICSRGVVGVSSLGSTVSYALVAGDCAVAAGASRGAADTRRGLIMPITRVAVSRRRTPTPAVQTAHAFVDADKRVTVYEWVSKVVFHSKHSFPGKMRLHWCCTSLHTLSVRSRPISA